MQAFQIYLIASLSLTSFIINANEIPEGFENLESKPKLIFKWPTVRVESVKYHLARSFLGSKTYLSPYLIKEKQEAELTDGREGMESIVTLEFWKLGTKKVEKKIWSISQEADKWQYYGWKELVLIKYGCCDSLNKYSFYNLKTGSLLRSVKGREIPEIK